jgi:hypothetical protein
MSKKIGLLWDSISDNMGDKAIGILLQRLFEVEGLPYQVVSPYAPETENIAALVIGGGDLIHEPGHPFFDVFRVPGRHILNTIGVRSGEDTGYLRDYRYVSMRSLMDQQRVGFGDVVPCLTLLYKDYLPDPRPTITIPENALGIHIHLGAGQDVWKLAQWLRQNHIQPTVWIPIMHHLHDARLLKLIASYVPNATVLPDMEPDDVFRTIGQLKFMVCTSLHATYFAYTQGVPFLAWTGIKKINAFMEERSLSAYGFKEKGELLKKLTYLQEPWSGVTPSQEEDRAKCRQAVQSIMSHAREALGEPLTPITIEPANAAWVTAHKQANSRKMLRIYWAKRLQMAWRDLRSHAGKEQKNRHQPG